jgi:nucleoid-associated protein YgaU
MMKVTKAILFCKDGPATGIPNFTLQCKFNPKDLSFSKAGRWTRRATPGAESAAPPEYQGPDPRTLTVNLLLDDWESLAGDVSKDIETLMSWTNPTPMSITARRPVAPVIVFQWGVKSYFECFVKNVTAKITMFRRDGTPVRADVTLQLEETVDTMPGTNPTSGGVAGHRSRTVTVGDTLHSIAYQEYKDPTMWRGLAAFNGIDDPLRVAVGSTVLIPPPSELEGLV